MRPELTNLSNEDLALDILADMVCQYLDSSQQEATDNNKGDTTETTTSKPGAAA